MVAQNMLRTYEEKLVFSEEEKSLFVTALDLIKCLLAVATIFELPPYISTMSRGYVSVKNISFLVHLHA